MIAGGPFGCVVSDCPWIYGREHRVREGDQRKYKLLTLDEIIRLSPPCTETAHLYLWSPGMILDQAFIVARAWGFEPVAELVWKKLTSKGNRHFGLGSYFRGEHESVIFATRGHRSVGCRNLRTVFEAAVGRHSQKPEALQDIAEKMSPGPYLEMFARRQRPGWVCWGNELNQGVK